MIGKYRMHEENVQIRGMIRNDHIRSLWKLTVLYPSDAIKAKNAHHPTPCNKDPKAFFLPRIITQNNQHERVEDECEYHKNKSHV